MEKFITELKKQYNRNRNVFIFDFDGTLIDSEPVHLKAAQQAYSFYAGKTLAIEELIPFIGTTVKYTFEELKKTRVEIDVEKMVNKKNEISLELTSKLDILPYFKEITKNFPNATYFIVSNQEYKNLESLVKQHNLDKIFKKFFSMTYLGLTKNYFYDNLEKFINHSKDNTIVFEDSQDVISKAKENNIFTVGILNSVNQNKLKKADMFIKVVSKEQRLI